MKKSLLNRLRSEADQLYFEVCALMYGNRCLICGKVCGKAHHFYAKGQYQHLRYDEENGINLCMECHSKIHTSGSKKEIEKEIIKKRGNDWYEKLKAKKNKMPYSFKNEKWYRENITRLKKIKLCQEKKEK